MQLKFSLILGLLFSSLSIFAQEGNLNIQAYNKAGAELNNIKVKIFNKNKLVDSLVTNASGNCNKILPMGNYKINFYDNAGNLLATRDSVQILANANKFIYPSLNVGVYNNEYSIKEVSTEVKIRSLDSSPIETSPSPSFEPKMEEVAIVGYATKSISKGAPLSTKRVLGKSYRPSGRVDEKSAATNTANIKANMLTATEINDFGKWNLWEDYAENDFKLFTQLWQIKPVERFAVLIKNEQHYAMPNVAVTLIDANGKELWNAITDNTGRAELWNYFNTKDSVATYPLQVIVKNGSQVFKQEPINAFKQQGVQNISINAPCNNSNIIDIAFVVDATGSMGDEIKYLQAELTNIINTTKANHKNLKINLGSVFYRDINDLYVARSTPLSEDVPQTVDFINAQQAMGGGDFPEALDSALEVGLHQLNWSENAITKIMFVILDAPAHDYAVEKMKALAMEAAKKGVRIIPIAASGVDKSTEYLLRSLALATNGTYVALTNHSGIGNDHIAPTTDNIKVELLSEAVERIIKQYVHTQTCNNPVVKNTKDVVPPYLVPLTTDLNLLTLKLFPNPANGFINVQIKKGNLTEFFVADMHGRILSKHQVVSKQNTMVNTSALPNGSYLVLYKDKEKMSAVPFIVQH
jgi:hypothetical protein